MPNARKSSGKAARGKSLICPECGFKAAHAMGLGRHRTSQHGVLSKRALAGRRNRGGTDGRKIAGLDRRVAQLERRYDELLKGLRRAAGAGRS